MFKTNKCNVVITIDRISLKLKLEIEINFEQ